MKEKTNLIYQRIAMQRKQTQPIPPKPADKPDGSWVLTSYSPGGCMPPPGNGLIKQAVCYRQEDVYEWRFVKNGEALNVGRGGNLRW